mmetsp:Transcript_23258/g.38784  ORF Transcript_23258/g.38784 Transcript_23258/m.38784 type:complete len:229 (-) Transcript_23258:390-1076(-)
MTDIKNQNAMRVMGVLLAILGLAEIILGGAASSVTNWNVGSWWVGVVVFICGLLACFSNTRDVVVTGLVFGVVSIICCVGGVILEGVFYGVTNDLAACWNQDTGEGYGDSDYQAYALICTYNSGYQCLCVQADKDSDCYEFDLQKGDDCGRILTELPGLLLAAMLVCLAGLCVAIPYTACTCGSVCGEHDDDQATPTLTTAINTAPPSAPATVTGAVSNPVAADKAYI